MSDSKAYFIIGVISTVVFAFLFWLIYFTNPAQTDASFVNYLPSVNAFLNSLTTVFLISGIFAIKNQKKDLHIKFMISATVTSAVFLVTYIIYHHFHGDTKFLGVGIIRYVYFFILITHIVLSMVMVPMVFMTLYHAGMKHWEKHKKIARVTFPIWLYVSVTGVLIYLFLNFLSPA